MLPLGKKPRGSLNRKQCPKLALIDSLLKCTTSQHEFGKCAWCAPVHRQACLLYPVTDPLHDTYVVMTSPDTSFITILMMMIRCRRLPLKPALRWEPGCTRQLCHSPSPPCPAENLFGDTDGLLRWVHITAVVTSWCGNLLLSVSADVRSLDDVIAF